MLLCITTTTALRQVRLNHSHWQLETLVARMQDLT